MYSRNKFVINTRSLIKPNHNCQSRLLSFSQFRSVCRSSFFLVNCDFCLCVFSGLGGFGFVSRVGVSLAWCVLGLVRPRIDASSAWCGSVWCVLGLAQPWVGVVSVWRDLRLLYPKNIYDFAKRFAVEYEWKN